MLPSADTRRRRRHIQGNFAARVCEASRAECAVCRKLLSKAAKPSAACGGCSEAEQGQRSQNASAIPGAPRDAGTATRPFQKGGNRPVRHRRSPAQVPPLARRLASDTPLRCQCGDVSLFEARSAWVTPTSQRTVRARSGRCRPSTPCGARGAGRPASPPACPGQNTRRPRRW